MSRIFISYRREDTSGYAGRLSDRLRSHFGDDQVFMDIDAIEPGLDYQEFIESTIDAIDVMVVLIGRQWLSSPTGRRRLEDPDDFVRLEIAGALERKIRVIPVLLEGAPMPTVHDLPPPVVPLAHRNAIEISDSRWDYDSQRLVSVLDRAMAGPGVGESLPTPPPAPRGPEGPPRGLQHQRVLTIVAAAAAVAGLIWGVLVPRGWHPEWAGLRITFEAILVVAVVVTLWSKQWRWAVGGGILGVVGLVIWAQLLLSGGHTISDLLTTPDGAPNVLTFVASVVVLGSGLVAARAEREPSRTA